MTPNSAYSLVTIKVGTNYTPVLQYTTFVDPNVGVTSPPGPTVQNGLNPPVFAMLCTTSNTSVCRIMAVGDTVATSFPAGTFVKGVVYYIYLGTLVADGGGSFIGYQYALNPLVY